MGLKLSTNNQEPPRMRTYSASIPGTSGGTADIVNTSRNGGQTFRARARSFGHLYSDRMSSGPLNIVEASGGTYRSNSSDSENSSPRDGHLFLRGRPHYLIAALQGIKCPVCSKQIPSDDMEFHLVLCLTKPRLIYNADVIEEGKGECIICLEDLVQGDTIARLPCLCIYHKGCIDNWFKVNRSCPVHPSY